MLSRGGFAGGGEVGPTSSSLASCSGSTSSSGSAFIQLSSLGRLRRFRSLEGAFCAASSWEWPLSFDRFFLFLFFFASLLHPDSFSSSKVFSASGCSSFVNSVSGCSTSASSSSSAESVSTFSSSCSSSSCASLTSSSLGGSLGSSSATASGDTVLALDSFSWVSSLRFFSAALTELFSRSAFAELDLTLWCSKPGKCTDKNSSTAAVYPFAEAQKCPLSPTFS
mmetsp:Transcript_39177/g.71083  ORF Transcript_39177/g.71083 Transcript_39177/m.71083 type:complete len:224 (+) Transcript_39177:142-813(+)